MVRNTMFSAFRRGLSAGKLIGRERNARGSQAADSLAWEYIKNNIQHTQPLKESIAFTVGNMLGQAPYIFKKGFSNIPDEMQLPPDKERK